MFGIGFSELVVIAVVALIFVGPKRLPEVMKQAGKFFVHIRRTANDVRGTFDQVVKEAEEELRREEAERLRTMLAAAKPATTVKAIEAGAAMSGTAPQIGTATLDAPVPVVRSEEHTSELQSH